MTRPLALSLALFAGVCVRGSPGPESGVVVLFDGFSPGWRSHWREQNLFAKPTRYDVVTDDGRPVLHAVSRKANAGLVRAVAYLVPGEARLRWAWKVQEPLVGNRRERERAGDDFAARVFVVFETSPIPLRTRAINYVWAASEKIGSMFPSPYTKNVGMIVLRSGDTEAGRWCTESRDVLADYRAFFGEAPSRISAVAVLVDTDNTKGAADAWFADLVLETKRGDDAHRDR